VGQCDTARVSSDARRDVVELRVGEQHPVRLAGLGTAGYRWVALVEGDEGVAEVSDADVAPPANARIGTSADELFTIRALRPGVTCVRFVQRRPWESEDEPAANEHVVEIRVH
jgi:predicted secreted protein